MFGDAPQGSKLLSFSQSQGLRQRYLTWLLIGCTIVSNQSEAIWVYQPSSLLWLKLEKFCPRRLGCFTKTGAGLWMLPVVGLQTLFAYTTLNSFPETDAPRSPARDGNFWVAFIVKSWWVNEQIRSWLATQGWTTNQKQGRQLDPTLDTDYNS